ncbi:MAG: FtsK/SpoIIIE family DNA translocase [Planctomycetota bacterium]
MKEDRSRTKAVECLVIAVLLVLFCSCISFDIGDWPSSFIYPHNEPTENWCGSIGAFCAYHMLYYLGPGALVILVSGIFFLAARLLNRTIDQLVLRGVGLMLLAVAASSSFYCLWPYRVYSFPIGSGGVLGVGAVQLLRSQFASVGTFILIGATWVVGFVLLADTAVLVLVGGSLAVLARVFGLARPAWSAARRQSQVMGEIWEKLSAKQKPMVAAPSLGPIADGAKPRQSTEGEVAKELKSTTAPAREAAMGYVPTSYEDYELPSLDLLAEAEYTFASVQSKVVKAKAAALEKLLGEFNVNARVVAADTGPVVTMFELELAAGVKVSQISALSNDMARALGVGAVRVVAPLPGKHTIGIEVPNSEKEKVRLKDIMQLAGGKPGRMKLPLFLGKDSSGEALVSDLTNMPHLLIAGTTGSGKSVCINGIIAGILLTRRPDEIKLILIDPKMVEMTAFNTIPHLMCPIVTETQRAVQILGWATEKMDERYALLAEARVKNITEYNSLGTEEIIERFNPSTAQEEAKIPKRLPYIVIVIDELADLMMTAAKEIEAYIVRLAQKSRAVGIHIVLATQRPQATVVTGLIKSNMPTRIGFRVAARLDSRIVLDQNGAETLLGEGDMLFLKPGTSDLVRAQGTFVDEMEVKRIVKYLREIAEPQFHPELTQLHRLDAADMERDELFDEGVRYARASRIIETMAAIGVLGEYKGSQAREVIMTQEEYEQLCEQLQAGEGVGGASSVGEPSRRFEKEDLEAQADSGKQQYGGSPEGEYHYATVEEED